MPRPGNRTGSAPVRTVVLALMALLGFASSVAAQQPAQRVAIDSIAITGADRVVRATILTALGFVAGDTIDIRDIQTAQKRLWRQGNGEFLDIRVFARGTGAEGDPVILEVQVEEAPYVRNVDIRGLERASRDVVEDSASLAPNQPFDPSELDRAEQAIRSALARAGIPFARIETRSEPVEGMGNTVDVIIDVEEGDRVAIAQYVIEGNEAVSDADLLSAIDMKPEGFWWFRTGEYDQRRFESDLLGALPRVYRSRGYLDFRILDDTVVVDPNTGKARVELVVEEGPQYRVASLNIEGNREFEDERLEPFFLPRSGGLLGSLGLGGDDVEARGRVFDAVAFEQASVSIQQIYANEGYIFASVEPTVTKGPPLEEGGDPTVALDIRIVEGQPAFIDEVNIVGNDFTYDRVIRERISVFPGDVYSQDRIMQSIQAIEGLGFFEPIAPGPDFIQVNRETGEVDVTFEVEEKQTGTINFGTSVGGGSGLSGFIGYEQPNLFGQAKSGSLRWDFGRFVNNFTLSFTDPALFQTRTSGTISLFNSRDRFFQFSSGRRRRIGGSARLGFPMPGGINTRLFTGYTISRTEYDLFDDSDDTSLFGRPPGTLSQVSLGITRSTLNNPLFPSAGSRQSWNVAINGGILGGDGDFTKHTAEAEVWTPVWQFGGGGGGAPNVISLGTKLRGGAIVGDVSDFPFERFWMGGVQFGENLRGYDETSVTPRGYFPENSRQVADIDRLGDAFLSVSTELAMRLGGQLSLRTFFDAGNTWESFDAVSPTQLFRGAGFGATVVTPFGPVGIDYAYGFDKIEPGWQFHFTFGQGF